MSDRLVEYVRDLSPWARKAAPRVIAAIDAGEMALSEHAGMNGAWVDSPDGRFFLDLSDRYSQFPSHAAKARLEDSTDPGDHVWYWADGIEDPVQVHLDIVSGRIKNWEKVRDLCKRSCPQVNASETILLRDVSVKSYKRGDGTVVKAHKRHHDSIEKFLGIGKTVKHGTPPKGSEDEPQQSKEWHIYKYPDRNVGGKNLPGPIQLVHPDTGDIAPAGTTVSPPETYTRKSLTGYVQQKGMAQETYDTDLRLKKKMAEVSAMNKAENALSARVRADLSNPDWTQDKRCALVVLLMNRHVFRVGSKGSSSKPKGKANEDATYDATYGATTLTTDQVTVSGGRVIFDFLGKSHVHWKAIETDESVARLVQDLVDTTEAKSPLFGVADTDVRDYLKPYGFNPHKFRTYWASYLFFKVVRDLVKEHGVAKSDKERKDYEKEAVKVAAHKLNDTDAAVKKNYILPHLMEQLATTGSIKDNYDLHEYHLSDQWFGYWLPDEENFHAWFDSISGESDLTLSEAYRPTVYLIRHGKTPFNKGSGTVVDKIRGWIDIPLTKEGKEEAGELAEKLKDKGIAVILSSDLKRARQTADILADGLGVQVEAPEKVFRPWNLGAYQGQPTDDVLPDIDYYATQVPNKKVPDGESFHDFKKRFLDGLRDAMEQSRSLQAPVAVVSHFRCVKLMEAWAATGDKGDNVDLEVFNKDDAPPGSIVKVRYAKGDRPTVVALADVLLGPWPELQEGDHWVTLKPHGPDSEDYVHVIIREHPDGSAHVVWAGDKGLEHLRITHRGQKADMERAEKAKAARALTPEEKMAQDQKREERKAAVTDEKMAYGQSLLKAIGAEHLDPEELLRALEKKEVRSDLPSQKTPEEREEDRRRMEERAGQILEGAIPEVKSAPDPVQGVTPQRAITEASLADLLGEAPHALSGVSDELKDAWNAARANPEIVAQIAALRATHTERLKDINKELNAGPKGTLRVHDRMAFYSEPGENDQALLRQAGERARYQMNSRFWHLNAGGKIRGEDDKVHDEPGLGNGAREFFYQGGTDALATISDRFASGKQVHLGMLQELGPEVMAAALATDIINRGEGVKARAEKSIRTDVAKKGAPTVADALAVAEEADHEREQIREEFGAQMLTDVARMNAIKNQTVRKQKALARAAGSLECAATVADFLRTGVGEGITIKAGEKLDAIRDRLDSLGLTDGDGYELRHGGDEVGVFISKENLPRLLVASDKQFAVDEEIQAIKSHKANTDDFEVPGLRPDYKPKPEQQATIRFAERQKKVYGNLSVGIGKTLTFGGFASRLIARGEAKSGWYIVPTNLLGTTVRELKALYPGMSIEVAHGELNPKARDKEERRKMYTSDDRPQILLIGQETVRMDSAQLKAAVEGPNAPGFILGDEVHSMFTPGEKEDPKLQSQRSRDLKALHAPHMLVMTGTPIRRSSVEVWKVLDWLHPGRYGSAAAWHLRYGKMGQGVSAYSGAVNEAFQQEINDTCITESDRPKTELFKHVHRVKMSGAQQELYKAEQRKYDTARQDPKADVRKLSSQKVQNQMEAIYSADPDQNAMIQQLRSIVADHEPDARGIVHCTGLKAVAAVVSAFKPGVALSYTGDDNIRRRDAIVSAINDGTLITQGRAMDIKTGHEGIITTLGDKRAKIRLDNGKEITVPVENLESKVKILCGTSNAVGVVSTGLNLQRGADWNVHFQLPDTAATLKQRIARSYRTGQKKDVNDHTLVPETPAAREKWQKIQEQDALTNAFDDPPGYDEHGLFSEEPEYDTAQPMGANLSDVTLGEHRSLHPDQKGEGSPHRGGKYVDHHALREQAGVPEKDEKPEQPDQISAAQSKNAYMNLVRKDETDVAIADAIKGLPGVQESFSALLDELTSHSSDILTYEPMSLEEAVANIRKEWADSTSRPLPILVMHSIIDEFFVDGETSHLEDWQELDRAYGIGQTFLRAYAREVYNRTQEAIADVEEDYLPMYRGMMLEHPLASDEPTEVTYRLQPLSSFTFSRAVADSFANVPHVSKGKVLNYANILKSRIPKEDIWSVWSTGIGSEREKEAIILGGRYRGLAVSALSSAAGIELGETHSNACWYAPVPLIAVKEQMRVARLIDEDDLAEEGVEENPHVTLQYAPKDESFDRVKEIIEKSKPVKASITGVGMFPASEHRPESDAVFLKIESAGMEALKAKVAKVASQGETYGKYKPHLTVAYVKPGIGQGMVTEDYEDVEFVIDHIVFSDRDGTTETVWMLG